jgi:NADH:ubiquinone oxidoreductase subunit 2 (subunit N)
MVIISLLERRYLVLAWAGLAFSAALSVPAGYILPVPEGSDMAVSGRFASGGVGPNTYACLVAIAFLGMLFFAFKMALPIAQRLDLGTGIFLGLIVFMLAGMALTWKTHKIVYVLFGSVLALQLHDSARRAPSPDNHEGLS